MRNALALLAGIAALSLAGCGPAEDREPVPSETFSQQEESVPPQATADPCGATRLGDYLNLLPTSEAMARIRSTAGHDRIRVINPGDAVTEDHRPDRLNAEVGVDGRIKLFRCG